MTSAIPSEHKLADLIEEGASIIVAALRSQPLSDDSSPAKPEPADAGVITHPPSPANGTLHATQWTHVSVIEGFETKWPAPGVLKAQGHTELHEHYGPMHVYEGHDNWGSARLAVGAPQERYEFYGKERGWVSVWEVINGRPARQLANFIEVDDFDVTHDRAALISGKDGAAKKGFAPDELHLLPPIYAGARIEVQRDRIVGPYSRNRLVVVATDDDVEVMLNHSLAHLRLRS